jgi:endonuclease YncB( thermonuclease family)
MGGKTSKTEKLTKKQLQSLKEADKTTPEYSLGGRVFQGKVVDVYDGDTVKVVIFVDNQLCRYNCRLMNIDAPEMRPRKNVPGREKIIESAKRSRDYLRTLIPEDGIVYVEVSSKKEKYGRLLVYLYAPGEDKDINSIMVETGHAKSYDGGTKDSQNGMESN